VREIDLPAADRAGEGELIVLMAQCGSSRPARARTQNASGPFDFPNGRMTPGVQTGEALPGITVLESGVAQFQGGRNPWPT